MIMQIGNVRRSSDCEIVSMFFTSCIMHAIRNLYYERDADCDILYRQYVDGLI